MKFGRSLLSSKVTILLLVSISWRQEEIGRSWTVGEGRQDIFVDELEDLKRRDLKYLGILALGRCVVRDLFPKALSPTDCFVNCFVSTGSRNPTDYGMPAPRAHFITARHKNCQVSIDR